jgi:hypothetical protein
VAIETLTALIPPLPDPLDGSGDWDAAERDLGTALPTDFKELIRLYGTGTFGGVYLANPLRQWGRDMIRDHVAGYRELRDALEFALPLFPERPGLLPWGSDSNGNLYCWWVDGPPDSWTVAQVAHEVEETPHRAPVGITEFLASYLLNRYPEMLGGGEFTAEKRRFERGLPWLR